MLSNKNYQALCADNGVYTVCEMDTDYNTRQEIILPSKPTGDVYSVAKLFTVTAIGLCVDRGLLSPEDKFLDVMGMTLPQGCDEKWKSVTLHMLLKHRFGTDKSGLLDIDAENASLYPTKDYLSLLLSTPLPLEPGVDYRYTDAAFYLLSLAVEKVTGQTLFDFLRPHLMDTMGFGEYAWSACPKGHTMGATGLFIRCEDMVKLGVLYLNGGTWKGTRIFSESWCRTVFEREYELAVIGQGWHGKGGMCEQMLAINPEKGLAIAWMGYSDRINRASLLSN